MTQLGPRNWPECCPQFPSPALTPTLIQGPLQHMWACTSVQVSRSAPSLTLIWGLSAHAQACMHAQRVPRWAPSLIQELIQGLSLHVWGCMHAQRVPSSALSLMLIQGPSAHVQAYAHAQRVSRSPSSSALGWGGQAAQGEGNLGLSPALSSPCLAQSQI